MNLHSQVSRASAIATQKFSGRLNLRVPPELHRKLAIEAANHGVPLNKYATERLTA